MKANVLTMALTANAAFSIGTGIVLVAAAVPMAGWLGIPTWLAIVVGAGLLPFGIMVARTARNPRLEAVISIIAADIAWVVGAVAIIVIAPEAMTSAGLWALGIVTIAVADFAALQIVGLRRLGTA